MPHHQTIPSSSPSQTSSYLSQPTTTRTLSSTPTSSSVTLVDAPLLAPESKSWARKIKARVVTLASIKNATSNIRPTSGASINSTALPPHNCKPILVKKVHSYKPHVPTVVLATVKSRPKYKLLSTKPRRTATAPSLPGPSGIKLTHAATTSSSVPTLPPLAFSTCESWSRQMDRQAATFFARYHIKTSKSKLPSEADIQAADDDWVIVPDFEEGEAPSKSQPPQVVRTSNRSGCTQQIDDCKEREEEESTQLASPPQSPSTMNSGPPQVPRTVVGSRFAERIDDCTEWAVEEGVLVSSQLTLPHQSSNTMDSQLPVASPPQSPSTVNTNHPQLEAPVSVAVPKRLPGRGRRLMLALPRTFKAMASKVRIAPPPEPRYPLFAYAPTSR